MRRWLLVAVKTPAPDAPRHDYLQASALLSSELDLDLDGGSGGGGGGKGGKGGGGWASALLSLGGATGDPDAPATSDDELADALGEHAAVLRDLGRDDDAEARGTDRKNNRATRVDRRPNHERDRRPEPEDVGDRSRRPRPRDYPRDRSRRRLTRSIASSSHDADAAKKNREEGTHEHLSPPSAPRPPRGLARLARDDSRV